ncbi:hypothetical protein ACEQ8H_006633 [Pleosporales sp. CAS-2024a]
MHRCPPAARRLHTTPARTTRFYKHVGVRETQEGLQVLLDSRPVRTPAQAALTLPASKPQLATAIALEWDRLQSAQQALKTHYLPLTSLAARALDMARADAHGEPRVRRDVLALLMRCLATDTLLCWAPAHVLNDHRRHGQTLRQLQMATATPILAHLTTHVWPGLAIRPILAPDSILPVEQDDATKHAIRAWLAALPAFELAGLERAVLASKSLLVGVRLIHEWGEAFAPSREPADAGRFGIDAAAEACSLEVRWQTSQWGEVEDTHDVDTEDVRRQLGSAVLLVSGDSCR